MIQILALTIDGVLELWLEFKNNGCHYHLQSVRNVPVGTDVDQRQNETFY